MVQFIRDSSFCVERSLYSLRAKIGYLDIRARIYQPPFPHSSFWKWSLVWNALASKV